MHKEYGASSDPKLKQATEELIKLAGPDKHTVDVTKLGKLFSSTNLSEKEVQLLLKHLLPTITLKELNEVKSEDCVTVYSQLRRKIAEDYSASALGIEDDRETLAKKLDDHSASAIDISTT